MHKEVGRKGWICFAGERNGHEMSKPGALGSSRVRLRSARMGLVTVNKIVLFSDSQIEQTCGQVGGFNLTPARVLAQAPGHHTWLLRVQQRTYSRCDTHCRPFCKHLAECRLWSKNQTSDDVLWNVQCCKCCTEKLLVYTLKLIFSAVFATHGLQACARS